jgi:hypothetical protein
VYVITLTTPANFEVFKPSETFFHLPHHKFVVVKKSIKVPNPYPPKSLKNPNKMMGLLLPLTDDGGDKRAHKQSPFRVHLNP